MGGEKMKLLLSILIGMAAALLFGIMYKWDVSTFLILGLGWANLAYQVFSDKDAG
jgi:hypothetical protein